MSIAKVAHRVAEQFPIQMIIKINGKPDPQKPIERYVPDISRLKDKLGLKEYTDLPEAIQLTLRWYSS